LDDAFSPEHHSVRVNGTTLHVAAAGPQDGPLLIFLHGFPEFWLGWKRQIPYFAKAGFRVLVPDQRGYNLSDKPKGAASYGLDPLADDVLGLIDWAGRKTTLLVGHDWGAGVAWWTALRNPERVEKLGIMNVPHPLVMRRHLTRDPAQMLRSWYVLFFQLPVLPELGMSLGGFWNLARVLRGTSNPGTFDEKSLARYREAWSQPGALTAMVNWYRAGLRHPPKLEGFSKVKPPTLILWGAKDRFLRRELAEASLALCEKGRLEFFEDATHWVAHEEPDRVNALLGEFMARPL
jgi:pimeloyl-ACP methyl ester carboxylesterase